MSVCLSVNALTARVLLSAIQTWYYHNRHDTYKVFDSWILLKWLCSKVISSFSDLAIGAAIHEVLFVFYSYPNDDTETATFDRTVLIVLAMLTTVV